MKHLGPLVRVRTVKPVTGFRVHLSFEDGTQKEVDLDPYLHGPIFEPIRNDPAVFCAMKVDGGTIAWDNGADIDPDVLYYGLTPAWMEEERIHRVFAHYDIGSEKDAAVPGKRAYRSGDRTRVEVPAELAPVIREIVAQYETEPA
jgi:hypothetical protein